MNTSYSVLYFCRLTRSYATHEVAVSESLIASLAGYACEIFKLLWTAGTQTARSRPCSPSRTEHLSHLHFVMMTEACLCQHDSMDKD